jgi:hypothetical protein
MIIVSSKLLLVTISLNFFVLVDNNTISMKQTNDNNYQSISNVHSQRLAYGESSFSALE